MRQLLLIVAGFTLGYLLMSQIKGCSSDIPAVQSDTLYKTDTVWEHYDTVVKKPMVITKVIHDTLPPEYIADPMYDSLKVQYEELVKEHLAKNIYEDTFKIGTLGHVIVYDTVKANKLGIRSYMADYMIPIIRDSIFITKTVQAPKKGELYIGGGFASNKSFQNSTQLGVLYKTKNDKIIGGYVTLMPGMQVGYGVQSYWRLTFKK
jgi:hypothetical protein